ncbi:MAG: SprB repeat-containing protein [Lewinellaceae bacterium]|nr:SprB repeat-containing protein [Lewinellaceae bacterium]
MVALVPVLELTSEPFNITGLTAGTYNITVTNGNGCTAAVTATVKAPEAMAITLTKTDVTTCDGTNGKITVNVTKQAIPNYSYNWTKVGGGSGSGSGLTTEPFSITGLVVGTYNITVTNGNGCTATGSKTISGPSGTAITATATAVLCNGATTGQINIDVTTGTVPNYSYNWTKSGGGTGSGSGITTEPFNITNLAAGTYTITVTNGNNCTATSTATITEPPALALSATVVNVLCNGASTGSIDLTVTGGTSPYTYNWGVGQPTTQDRTGLSAGTYTVTVTDANNCTEGLSKTITQPPALALDLGPDEAVCGYENYTVAPTVSGGVSPYTYSWNTGASSSTITIAMQNSAVTISLTVTDANGCAKTDTKVITPNYNFTNGGTIGNAQSNCGAFDPAPITSVTLPSGGTGAGATEYLWLYTTTTCGTPPTIDNMYGWQMAPGTNNGPTYDPGVLTQTTCFLRCSRRAGCTQYLGESNIIQMTINGATAFTTSTTPVSCNNGTDGKITVDVTTGTVPNYSYNWTKTGGGSGSASGITTEPFDITGLAAGSYQITVTNGNGCTGTGTATVSEPPLLVLSTTVTNSTCGNANGSIDLTVTGGTAPYTYNWGVGQPTTQDRTGLSAGTYTVTVTDANGCTKVTSATVNNIGGPSLSATVVNVLCNGASTGSIDLTVTGGTSPYTYNWGVGQPTTQDRTSLTAGTYTVTVTDANNCTAVLSKTITQPPALTVDLGPDESVCSYENYTVTPTVSGGVGPYTYAWSTGATSTTVTIAMQNSPVTVSLTVTDANGCTKADTKVLTPDYNFTNGGTISGAQSNCGSFDPAPITSVTLPSGGTGAGATEYLWLYTTTTCGTPPTIDNMYGWQMAPGTNNGPTYDPGVLTQTTCFLRCSRRAGCTYYLGESNIIQMTINGATAFTTSTTPVSCNNGTDGKITVDVTTGTVPNYSYNWTKTGGGSGSGSGITTEPFDITGLAAGSYQITVTNGNGCTSTGTATVSEPAQLVLSTTVVNATCGNANGSIDLTVTGGTAPYTYNWGVGQPTTQDGITLQRAPTR